MAIDILVGDCRTVLRGMDERSVHTIVTSPPYFGLRDYDTPDQIGLEETPEAYVAALVGVFRELRRVLRDDGSAWLNLGDSYVRSAKKGGSGPEGKNRAYLGDGYGTAQSGKVGSSDGAVGRADRPGSRNGGVAAKEKDLIGIPWRVAFALQADGWYLRQDIIWAKPNPMPESVQDRCTKAHEYVFLLTKGPRYYFDADAISEPAIYSGVAGMDASGFKDPGAFGGKHGAAREAGKPLFGTRKPVEGEAATTRNKRSVWTVPTQPFAEAHFATYPPELIKPCILAGCPVGGTVLDPFGGAGTTALVADRLQRNAVLIEVNPKYAEMARRRVTNDRGMLALME